MEIESAGNLYMSQMRFEAAQGCKAATANEHHGCKAATADEHQPDLVRIKLARKTVWHL
jgi:hypothetical protein